MSTAQEIELKMAAVLPRLAAISEYVQAMLHDASIYGAAASKDRIVCARRARKLRHRGEVVRLAGRTSTGKARYVWLRRVAPWAIYKGA